MIKLKGQKEGGRGEGEGLLANPSYLQLRKRGRRQWKGLYRRPNQDMWRHLQTFTVSPLYFFFCLIFKKCFVFFVGFHFILLLDRRVSRRIIVVQRLTLRFSVGLARNWKRWWSHNDVIDVVILTPQSLDPHRSDESIPASLETEAWVSSTPAASTWLEVGHPGRKSRLRQLRFERLGQQTPPEERAWAFRTGERIEHPTWALWMAARADWLPETSRYCFHYYLRYY